MDDRFFEYSLFLFRCPELLLLKRVKGMVSEKPEEDFFQDFWSFFWHLRKPGTASLYGSCREEPDSDPDLLSSRNLVLRGERMYGYQL